MTVITNERIQIQNKSFAFLSGSFNASLKFPDHGSRDGGFYTFQTETRFLVPFLQDVFG